MAPPSFRSKWGKWISSSFAQSRSKQLTRETPDLWPLLFLYENYVPEHAVVATDTRQIGAEYFFFGDRLSRRIIPLHSFDGTQIALPADAQYLLYSEGSRYAHGRSAALFSP